MTIVGEHQEQNEDQLQAGVLDLGNLPDMYFIAKQAVLFYETRERQYALEAITDLRDVLDHLMLAASATTQAERASEFVSAREHLRRAAIEPLESAVETRLARSIRKYNWLKLAPVLLVARPEGTQVDFMIQRIQEEIEEVRENKNANSWERAIEHCGQAYKFCSELDRMLPDRSVYLSRFFAIALALVSGVVGYMISQHAK